MPPLETQPRLQAPPNTPRAPLRTLQWLPASPGTLWSSQGGFGHLEAEGQPRNHFQTALRSSFRHSAGRGLRVTGTRGETQEWHCCATSKAKQGWPQAPGLPRCSLQPCAKANRAACVEGDAAASPGLPQVSCTNHPHPGAQLLCQAWGSGGTAAAANSPRGAVGICKAQAGPPVPGCSVAALTVPWQQGGSTRGTSATLLPGVLRGSAGASPGRCQRAKAAPLALLRCTQRLTACSPGPGLAVPAACARGGWHRGQDCPRRPRA